MPILALAAKKPFWRDFITNVKGDDVASLQRELTRLGHRTPITRNYDSATRRSVGELQKDVSIVPADDGSLHLSSLLWLPKAETTVAECVVGVGATVEQATPIAAASAELQAVRITSVPAGAVAGKRHLVMGDRTFKVDNLGRIVSRAELATFASSEEYRAFVASKGEVQLQATYELVEPVDVFSVPPAALVFAPGDSSSCLVSPEGQIIEAKVVTSTLGRSLVQVPHADNLVVLSEPAEGTSCR